MIFYCDLQGNLKAFQNETVYQGSNNVTTIYVVAPFSRPVGLNISFTKPNKLVTSPAIMKWVGTLGNVKIPVSFVNIPEQFTDTYNVWAYALPYSITEQNGVVGVSVNAVIADSVDASGQQAYKGNLTTFTGQFTVAYSALPSPPTDIPTEWTQDKVLDLLNNYYNDAIQKIGEMNTLKTDVKDTLVKAINEVFDEIASTNATIGDLSTLTTDEKGTIVGAINEVDNHADTAQQTAETAQTTADNATTLANTGISIAEQAQTTANNAVATANGAKTIAEQAKTIATNSVYSVSFEDIQSAVTALNGYDNAYFKVGNSIYLKQKDVPDMWVYSVASEYVEYTYTTDDDFVNALLLGTVQVGYYVLANLESTGDYDVLKNKPIINQDLSADGFTPVENTYYRHTGTTSETYTAGVIYFYNGTAYKAIDGAGGEVPTSLPATGAKITGNLPTSGWTSDTPSWIGQNALTWTEKSEGRYYVQGGTEDLGLSAGGSYSAVLTIDGTDYSADVEGILPSDGTVVIYAGYFNNNNIELNIIDHCVGFDDNGEYIAGNGYLVMVLYMRGTVPSSVIVKSFSAVGGISAIISNSAIKVNSAVTMYIDYNGKIKAGGKADGSITVSADETPTDDIPYTLQVVETSAEGAFEIINSYVPTIPETPTALPQTASALKSGSLPTSGWTNSAQVLLSSITLYANDGDTGVKALNKSINSAYYNYTGLWEFLANGKPGTQTSSPSSIISIAGKKYRKIPFVQWSNMVLYIDQNGNLFSGTKSSYLAGVDLKALDGLPVYTISDTSITANSDILMELTDEGGVKANALANGSITVIRDTVPTQPIPYTYKVKQTNASGQFTLVNHFVPTKTSDLQNDSGFITAADIGNALYPVGSIYMSVNNTNPSTFFGGTWEAWGAGKVPVGVDTGDTDFATVEKTGGEKTHILTESEMPKHSHGLPTFHSNPEKENITFADTAFNADKASDGAVGNGGRVISAGGGQAHNNLQPYITCYMWKRIN